MKAPHTTLLLMLGSALAAGGFFAGRQMPSTGMATAAETTASSKGKVLYWHDPMVPSQRFDKPGKSPFMEMQLVPVYAQDAGDTNGVAVSAAVQQNLGIRLATVHRAELPSTFDAVGTVLEHLPTFAHLHRQLRIGPLPRRQCCSFPKPTAGMIAGLV